MKYSLVMIVFSGLACMVGCNPSLKGPGGSRVSLAEYPAVNVKSVRIAEGLPYHNLPDRLASDTRLLLMGSAMWRVDDDTCRSVDLTLDIINVEYPDRGARVVLGLPKTMKTLVQVHDGQTGVLLGTAEVEIKLGSPGGGLLGGGVAGVFVNNALDTDLLDLISFSTQTAGEVVDLLNEAKREGLHGGKLPAAARVPASPPRRVVEAGEFVPFAKLISPAFQMEYADASVRTQVEFVAVGAGVIQLPSLRSSQYVVVRVAPPASAVRDSSLLGGNFVAVAKEASEVLFSCTPGDLLNLEGSPRFEPYAGGQGFPYFMATKVEKAGSSSGAQTHPQ